MAVPDLDNLAALLDDAKCFALVRQHRWPDGVCCPACASSAVIRDGCDDTQRSRQRYRCEACAGRFDDLTGTVLAGHHQPLRVWVLCLCFMGLNLSNWRGAVRRLWGKKRTGGRAYDGTGRGAAAPFLVVQNPVFELGPWAAAHLRVVTSRGAIPVRKLICRAAHPLHLWQRRVR